LLQLFILKILGRYFIF